MTNAYTGHFHELRAADLDLVRQRIDAGDHLGALTMITSWQAVLRPSQVPASFRDWVRTTIRPTDKPPGLVSDTDELGRVTGGWHDAPPAPHAKDRRDVSTDPRAAYRVRHHLMFDDFAAAATELRKGKFSIAEGDSPELVAWARATCTDLAVEDGRLFFTT